MIKFTFKENGITTTKEFEKYSDMLRFVATSGVKDEDFIGLQFGQDDDADKEVISGITGLINKAVETADRMDAVEAMMESLMAEDFPEDATPIM